jgi:mannose-1-phosphate guanylyltransferase/phosphomannomutase
MKAVVMAGGAGSRLRPLTVARPKPMVSLLGKPVLEHILALLKRHGIEEVILTLQYMAPVIQNYFGDGEAFGMKIHYSIEDTPLGTAGSVKLAQDYLDEPFLVISGDALTDFDLREIIAFHRAKRALATLTLYRVPNPLEYGVVVLDHAQRVTQFAEKPSWGDVFSDTVNTGIYVLDPQVLDEIPSNCVRDFSQDVFPALLSKRAPMYGYVAAGYWCDVGDHATYVQANADFLTGKVQLPIPGQRMSGQVWGGEEVEIAPDAQLYGPVFLGRGAKLKDGVIVHGPTFIGDYTVLDTGAQVDRSLIWRNSYIGERAEVRGAIICRQCRLKSGVAIFEGAILGDNCIVGENAIIHQGVRVWPEKEIESGATIKTSVIWGAQGRRSLFGRYGVTGLVNVDLTPEFAAKLGAAFGALHKVGALVTVNRDLNKTSRMIKRGIVAGLPASGVNVIDLENVPIPVACYYTHASHAVGGVHVRLSPYDRRVVDIKFFTSEGLPIDKQAERTIERIFFREDFRRVYLDDIGHIENALDVVERYSEHFCRKLSVSAMRRRKFKLVVDYAHAPASLVLPRLLNELGCNVIALNSTLDPERMSVPREDFERDLEMLGRITNATNADLGVRFDVGGERIFLVSAQGARVPDRQLKAAMVELALRVKPEGRIVAPAHTSLALERIVAKYGGQVTRAKLDAMSLMTTATQAGALMAADGAGGFIFPEFQAVMDGLFAIAKLLEWLTVCDTHLSAVLSGLPPNAVAHRTVACAWATKGRVMRLLSERFQGYKTEQVDGLRLNLEHEWVLIAPDPEEPLCHVYAESRTERESRGLLDKYVNLVIELQKG